MELAHTNTGSKGYQGSSHDKRSLSVRPPLALPPPIAG